MSSRAITLEEFYTPNPWVAFGAAAGFHLFLLVLNPTILKATAYQMSMPVISVKVLDHLPLVQQPKPVLKHEPKHVPKKAKKSGLSMHHERPAPVSRPKLVQKTKAAPKPFVSKITIPKFVPSESDEPIAASPLPGRAPAISRHSTPTRISSEKLSGKSRGVRAEDIHFELSDGAGAAIVIPVGQERGDTAMLHSGGSLVGKDRKGRQGFHGIAKADSYIEGSLSGSAGKGGRVVAGKGFEIGGPVGDRKIIQRRLPEYPTWAEEKGITALVKIYFTVRPDGTIRPNMRIQSSSGYTELDDLAKQALLQWRFSPTSDESSTESAWGIITFRYTLS